MTENKCEPNWDGNKYVNCEKCTIKDECGFWQELTKYWNIYSENGGD